ncbi:FtsX-like permease family protein [Agromyces sp. ZXT2-6]|uniref:FtsX-like permease family protein n=1 Tax=Agromyces sp. ZXT2-6 TaxID=3461153 RepID=UPI004054E070
MARVMLARARARFGVLAGVATVAFLLTAFLAVVLGILVSAPTSAARAAVVAAEGSDGAARWHTRLAGDATAQADAAARVLDRFVAPHSASWGRSVQTAPIAALGGDPLRVVLLADPAAPARADLVEGAWPDDAEAADAAASVDALPAAVHAGAAAATGLESGSVVELEGARLLVVGLWAPVDPADPAWAGDPLVSSGAADDAFGPVLVDEAALADVEGATTVRWTVVADATTADAASLAALRAAFPSVTPALANEPDLGGDGIIESGRLDQSLDRLLAGLDAVRALAPLPLLLLGVAGLVALVRLAALLAAERRRETTLLLARGASPSTVARDAAVEAFAIAAPAVVVGTLAGTLALSVAAPLASTLPALPWLVGGGVLLVVAGVLTGTAWAEARRPVVRGSGDETGRTRRAFTAGGVVVLLALAAIALWQFRLYGSPLVPSAGGSTRVDPLAALAPVLVLLALAVSAVAVAGGAGRLLERWGATRPGLVPALPARQLARRTPLYASAVLVLAFAAGGLALTASVDGSWRAFDRAAAAAELGGEVRVALPGRSVVADDDPSAGFDADSAGSGGTAAIPVFRGEVRVGSDPAGLVALPTERLADAAPAAGTPLPPAVATALSAGERGPAVAPGSQVLLGVQVSDAASADPVAAPVIEADAGTGAGRAALAVWLLDADGVAHRIPAGEAAPGRGPAPVATAPDLDGLTLLGVEARLTGGGGDLVVTVADVIAEPGGSTGLSGEMTVSSTSPADRIAAAAADAVVPVVIDRRLAALTDASPGDPIEFRVQTGGATVRAEVADVVAVVAGAEPAILADLAAIGASAFASGAGVPQHTEVWIASDDPAATASTLLDDRSAGFDVDIRADASSTAAVAPALTALWIGAAGAAGFALVALAGLVAALAAARAGEVAVLRALGTTARGQAAARRTELLGVALTATAIGVAIGLVVALLTAPELGRAAVPGAATGLATSFAPSWLPFALGVAVLAAGGVAVAVAAARAVRVRALTALPGGEDR